MLTVLAKFKKVQLSERATIKKKPFYWDLLHFSDNSKYFSKNAVVKQYYIIVKGFTD